MIDGNVYSFRDMLKAGWPVLLALAALALMLAVGIATGPAPDPEPAPALDLQIQPPAVGFGDLSPSGCLEQSQGSGRDCIVSCTVSDVGGLVFGQCNLGWTILPTAEPKAKAPGKHGQLAEKQ